MKSEIVRAVADKVDEGGVAVIGDRVGELQTTAISADGSAEMVTYEFPYYGTDPDVRRGLRMTGVMRRRGLLRRFTEAGPTDIARGDKVVFETEDGKVVKSLKVDNRFNHQRPFGMDN